MSLTLHSKSQVKNIQPAKRIGRGLGSGKGAYSTKGVKGQKARTGGRKGLKRFGMKPNISSIPKLPGFNSRFPKLETVNLVVLNKHFKDGDKVNLATLQAKGLITYLDRGLKILGDGHLTKKLTIVADKISEGALAKIKQSGSEIKLISVRKSKGAKAKA